MAERELWEIQLDLKIDKLNAGEKAYDQSMKKIEQYDKRFTAAKTSEIKIREKFVLAGLEEEKRASKLAFNEQLAMAKAFDAALLEDRKRTNAQIKAEQDKLNQPGPSMQLKGDVGSQAYVNMLKSVRAELNPTSAEYKQLTNTISLFQAELNKVNKSSGLQAFKSLTIAIKETKGELARLAAEQKTGTAEWQKYSDKLRELQRQKQLIQRETKLTSQQLIAMSRDLTVVAYGLRQIGTDIISLSEGKKSAGEMAMAIGGIGMQVLVVLPAIHGLTKALEAAGIVSASTIAKLGAMASTLGTLLGGVVAVTAAYGMMVGAATHALDIFNRLGEVLSGQKSYWEAVSENIKDVTFGLIDFTSASNDFDSSNVQQQLSDLAYIANFSANAMDNLKQSVQNALQLNEEKFRRSGLPFFKEFTEEEFKQQQRELKRVNTPVKKGGSPKGGKTQEKDPIDEMLTGIANEVKFRELTKNLTVQFLDEQIKLIQAVDTENLKLEQKIKLLEAIKTLRSNELIGIDNIPDARGLDMSNIPGLPFGYTRMKHKSANAGDLRPDMTSGEFEAMIQAEIEKERAMLSNTEAMWNNFQGMLESTGLMKGDFGEIVNIINALISGGKSAFGFIDALGGLLGFIPGGGAVSSAIGGLSGGGGGMGFNGGSMPNIGMPERNPQNLTVILKNPVTFRKQFEIESENRDLRIQVVNG